MSNMNTPCRMQNSLFKSRVLGQASRLWMLTTILAFHTFRIFFSLWFAVYPRDCSPCISALYSPLGSERTDWAHVLCSGRKILESIFILFWGGGESFNLRLITLHLEPGMCISVARRQFGLKFDASRNIKMVVIFIRFWFILDFFIRLWELILN